MTDAIYREHPATLDLENDPTVLLVWAANRFNRSASRHYQNEFGISAMDWRMLVTLFQEPDVPVTAATPVVGFDKGAVSRSLSHLAELGLAEATIPESNPRSRLWHLTPAGLELHNRILAAALHREDIILDGFTRGEVWTLVELLQRLMKNLEALPD